MEKLSSILGNGFKDLMNYKFNIMGFLWLIFFILSIGGCFYLISKSIIDYRNYDFITNIKIKYETMVDFPAVTLCTRYLKNPNNLYILQYKFAVIPDSIIQLVQTTDDLAQLEQWLDQVLDSKSLTEINFSA